jgi:hypothetical protein
MIDALDIGCCTIPCRNQRCVSYIHLMVGIAFVTTPAFFVKIQTYSCRLLSSSRCLDFGKEKSAVRMNNESSYYSQQKNSRNEHMRLPPHGFHKHTN